ncbi:MAG: ArgR family transcriptional regulator [Atopobiaceae bacterium]|nr:ArgR family transcriptional regulator [Atopobiaceae bacterium]MBR3312732.1 ArgR family transcriptional regulator [Atopobiaceae bacterium]
MKRRNDRQDAIRWIVRNRSIRTQKDLVEELRLRGYACTQATASRDIAEMGLRKLPEGVYVLAEDLHLQRMVSEFVTDVEEVTNLVVIKTQPGTAAGVAAAVDATGIADVMGSIAGSDTVLIITRSNESAGATAELIDLLCAANKSQQ